MVEDTRPVVERQRVDKEVTQPQWNKSPGVGGEWDTVILLTEAFNSVLV